VHLATRIAANVVLVGGASSTGKTTLARGLADSLGGRILSLDPLRAGPLEEELSAPLTWRRAPEEIVELLVAAGEAFAPLLADRVAEARGREGVSVIEGERVLPRLLSALGAVDALFLVEDRRAAIRRSLLSRPGGFASLPLDVQANVVEVDYRLGTLVASEASGLGYAVLRPQPWPTLLARATLVFQRESAG
jgi:hypothetical protein